MHLCVCVCMRRNHRKNIAYRLHFLFFVKEDRCACVCLCVLVCACICRARKPTHWRSISTMSSSLFAKCSGLAAPTLRSKTHTHLPTHTQHHKTHIETPTHLPTHTQHHTYLHLARLPCTFPLLMCACVCMCMCMCVCARAHVCVFVCSLARACMRACIHQAKSYFPRGTGRASGSERGRKQRGGQGGRRRWGREC